MPVWVDHSSLKPCVGAGAVSSLVLGNDDDQAGNEEDVYMEESPAAADSDARALPPPVRPAMEMVEGRSGCHVPLQTMVQFLRERTRTEYGTLSSGLRFRQHTKVSRIRTFHLVKDRWCQCVGSHLVPSTGIALLCKGSALVTVKNTEVDNGPEAWRGLNAAYDSNSTGRQRARIQCLLQPKRAESILQATEADRKCDVREYEPRFGKTLDEDVKIGVILAVAPPHVQNHCHVNSHILKRYAQVRTMLFDYCRAQADTVAGDVVPMDLSMLGKGKGEKVKGDKKGKGKDKGKGKKSENSKDEKDRRRQERQRQRPRQGQCQNDQALSWVLPCLQGPVGMR